MQVYKAFFKVIHKNLGQIMIYVVVFMVLAVLMSTTYTPPGSTDFTETKVNVAFVNHDEESPLVLGLKDYLGDHANLVNLPDDTQKLQDALFFRKVEYIVTVPDGFTRDLIAGKNVQLEKTIVPDSTSGIYVDMLINKYLNTAKTYTTQMTGQTQTELVAALDTDLAHQASVSLVNSTIESGNAEKSGYYYNFLAYSLFAILILGVSAVMLVFNDPDLKKRNLSSPLKNRTMNLQMILGNFSFTLVAWLLMILISFFMYGSYMFTTNGLLLILNSFVFALTALSISFLIGNLVKSKAAMSAVSNVVSLGTCFIGGVFVPQYLLGDGVLTLASFTPTFWYVKANNDITSATTFNPGNLSSIFSSMLLVFAFGIAVLAITLVIIKQKRQSA
jgi:ABC-2 type transport system permease protein